eukprot:CAMPEP_0117456438 /NCGR_PEP_ID=MMETSP0759-20121206/11877_1 /TAXON_ID=63605 /ORGANISM="Percolomonas cosmopolitus, Strain WS" /LENGTH=314 /DNA_ID=CAMNT_0005249777 /DNA_START=571 /DNA_END=1512 /DNA_ORIENTATION=-
MSTTKSLSSLSPSELSSLFKSITTFVFDCDGVLYSGGTLFPYSVPCLRFLRKHGKRVIFLSNNDTISRRVYMDKFVEKGLEPDPNSIYSSGSAAAKSLAKHLHTRRRQREQEHRNDDAPRKKDAVLYIGMDGLKEELQLQMHNVFIFGDEFNNLSYNEDEVLRVFKEYSTKYRIQAVLLGYDRAWNLFKLAFAILSLREIPECEFWATACDTLIPWGDGNILPGVQPIVRSIEEGSQRKLSVICGKPSTFIIDEIMEEHSINPDQIMVIGDQLETDITMANRTGTLSTVVLSGVCSAHLLDEVNSSEERLEQRP